MGSKRLWWLTGNKEELAFRGFHRIGVRWSSYAPDPVKAEFFTARMSDELGQSALPTARCLVQMARRGGSNRWRTEGSAESQGLRGRSLNSLTTLHVTRTALSSGRGQSCHGTPRLPGPPRGASEACKDIARRRFGQLPVGCAVAKGDTGAGGHGDLHFITELKGPSGFVRPLHTILRFVGAKHVTGYPLPFGSARP